MTLVDPERLARWMDERDLPGRGEPVTCRFITGGASNELFEIRRGEVRMALRRPPAKVPEGRSPGNLKSIGHVQDGAQGLGPRGSKP